MVSKTWFQDDNVANPTATVTAETVYTVVVILAAAVAGNTYQWTGAGIVGNANVDTPTMRPTTTATYSVTVTNADGCESTQEVTVTVNTPVDVNIVSNTTICEGAVPGGQAIKLKKEQSISATVHLVGSKSPACFSKCFSRSLPSPTY